jgi:TolA-binding protein
MICLVITTVLAWVMLNKTNKTEVSFMGVPLDKRDFEKHEREDKEEHNKIFARLDAMQARINPLEGEIRAMREASEINNNRLLQIDAKMDRLIERTSS